MSQLRRHLGIAVLVALGFLGTPLVLADEPAPPAPAPAPAAIAAPAPVEKAVIELEDKAKGNGEIRFVFTPTGGAPTEVRVTVAEKMGAEAVAKDVLKEFSIVLGDNYAAERYDERKVKIVGKKNATFSLAIASQNVTGLAVRIK